jgi:hypothetical protein
MSVHKLKILGWGYRVRLFHNYLVTLPRNQTVILSDGDDLLLMPGCTSTDLLNRYRIRESAASPVWMAAERYCWPDWTRMGEYEHDGVVMRPQDVPDPRVSVSKYLRYQRGSVRGMDGEDGGIRKEVGGGIGEGSVTRDFRYLNAGWMMGPAGVIADMLKRIYVDDCADDQGLYTESYLNPDMIWVEKGSTEVNVNTVNEHGKGGKDNERGTTRSSLKTSSTLDPDEALDMVESAIQNLVIAEEQYVKGDSTSEHLTEAQENLARAVVLTSPVRDGVSSRQGSVKSLGLNDKTHQNSRAESVGLPARARPLIALDFDMELSAAMNGIEWNDIRIRKRSGRIEMKDTGASPCILHQNGRKIENRLLEEIARAFQMPFDERAILNAEQLKQKK